MLAPLAESSGCPPSAPWRNEHAARNVLSSLAWIAAVGQDRASAGDVPAPSDRAHWASWLERNDLAALAFEWAREADPGLASRLRAAAFGAAAGNLAHFETLDRIERRFAAERIPMVLLKGAAVAATAYRDPAFRPMTDLDIWVGDADIPRACDELRGLGFRQDPGLPHRPPALQKRSCGEVIFRHARRGHGLVELHYGAFQGWWIQRAARPDTAAVWNRATSVGPGRHARCLAAEDAILQTAFHVVVNQFGQAPWRGLMDLAVLSRSHRIDWDAVVDRAVEWRLRTATWLVLDTANRLIGLPGCDAALTRLRPARARRATLHGFASPKGLLAGRERAGGTLRHAFMLSLVDRRKDGARLVGRTLWPEPWWVAARYGRPVGRVQHLWAVVRRGEV